MRPIASPLCCVLAMHVWPKLGLGPSKHFVGPGPIWAGPLLHGNFLENTSNFLVSKLSQLQCCPPRPWPPTVGMAGTAPMPWAHNHPIATHGISHPSLRPAAAPTIFRKIPGSFQKCQIAKLHHRDNQQARWQKSEGTFLQVVFCLELIDAPLKGPF